MDNEIKRYIEEVMKKAGLDKMPKDFLDQFRESFTEEAKKRLGLTVLKALNTAQVEELDQLVKKGASQKKINEFLEKNIPDLRVKAETALRRFGKEVIENSQE